MRIIVATVQVPFVRGGAEIQAETLRDALRAAGHDAEIVAVPFKWYPPEKILDHILACRLLDLTEVNGTPVDLLIGLKFPAYLIPHPHKVLWIIHQYRGAYDLWDHPYGDLIQQPDGAQVRDAIRAADTRLIPEAKGVFTDSVNVARRLEESCHIKAEPLYHPPLGAEQFYSAKAQDYFFFPSRLCLPKRQKLILEALSQTKQPVRLRFAGAPDSLDFADELRTTGKALGVEKRVEWLGAVTEKEKLALYANSTAIVYPPLDEDYGYVTLEAMLSSKPVITCSDSGGPLEFIRHNESGLVAAPDAKAIAQAMDQLWADRGQAESMGKNARLAYQGMNISWPHVVNKLLSAR